jgi:hypothetical protein
MPNPLMKKIYKIITVLFLLVLLCSLVSKWYRYATSINIMGKYQLFSTVGKIESNGQIKGLGGKEGWLVFGPYMQLKEGNYAVEFELVLENPTAVENPSKIVGYCDVDIEGHPEMSKHIDLAAGTLLNKKPKRITTYFTVPSGNPKMQYRVFQYGGNSISLMNLRINVKSFWLQVDNLKDKLLRKDIIFFALILFFCTNYYYYRVRKRHQNPIKEV